MGKFTCASRKLLHVSDNAVVKEENPTWEFHASDLLIMDHVKIQEGVQEGYMHLYSSEAIGSHCVKVIFWVFFWQCSHLQGK